MKQPTFSHFLAILSLVFSLNLRASYIQGGSGGGGGITPNDCDPGDFATGIGATGILTCGAGGGGGITSLNGLTDATQLFATPGTSGTAPAWVSSVDTHTLNIPLASASSVTAGLISRTNFDTFNNKQTATLTDGKFWVGNGSNVATAVTPSGDVTFGNTGVFAIGSSKVINAMLAGSIAASKLVGTDIATLGTITSGTWAGTTIAVNHGGTSLATLTANNVMLGNGTSAPLFVAPGTIGNLLTSDGSTWISAPAAGGGNVVGPSGGATNNAVAVYDGTSGLLIKNGSLTISGGGIGGQLFFQGGSDMYILSNLNDGSGTSTYILGAGSTHIYPFKAMAAQSFLVGYANNDSIPSISDGEFKSKTGTNLKLTGDNVALDSNFSLLGTNSGIGIGTTAGSFGLTIRNSGGNLITVTNAVDATLNVTSPSSGLMRLASDSAGRKVSMAGGDGTVDDIIVGGGTVKMPTLATSSSAQTGTVCSGTAGNLTVDTTTTCLLSGAQFKEEIEPLNIGLREVMRLRPVSYQLKKEFNPTGLGRQVGFVAQDVQEIDDRLVAHEENGDVHGVRYLQLTAILAKAMQEMETQILQLKSIVLAR